MVGRREVEGDFASMQMRVPVVAGAIAPERVMGAIAEVVGVTAFFAFPLGGAGLIYARIEGSAIADSGDERSIR